MNEISNVSVSLLQIDRSYQRTIKRVVVSSIVKCYNQDAFGTLLVGRRKDSSMWVIDGQQRLTAAKELGHDCVPCKIIESKGPKHEAMLFRLVNGGRQQVTSNELFRAALEAGDQQSVEIVAAIERCGFALTFTAGSNSKPTDIRQSKPMEIVYEWGGAGLIERVLNVIRSAWATEQTATRSYIIQGIGRFFRDYKDADDKRVAKCLREISPVWILRHAEDGRQLLGGNRAIAVRDVIVASYNKRLSAGKRLAVAK